MNPTHLHARNFRSWRKLDLELPPGCTAISGANGAGKSSLLAVIELALYAGKGELARHFSRDPDGDVVEVAVTFEHAGRVYRVRRSWSERARKGELHFDEVLQGEEYQVHLAPGESVTIQPGFVSMTCETAAETQGWIEQLLGIDRRTFRASSYIAQGDSAAFTAAQPRERKDILAAILGLEVWDRLVEQAKADRRGSQSRLDEIRGRVAHMDVELAEAGDVAERLHHAEAEQREDERLVADLRDEVAQVRAIVEQYAAADRDVAVARATLLAAQGRVADANTHHERLRRQVREARDGDLSPADRSLADRLPALEAEQVEVWEAQRQWRERDAERQKALREYEAAAAEVSRLVAEAGDAMRLASHVEHAEHCPTCEQVLGAEARATARHNAEFRAQTLRDQAESANMRCEQLGRAVPDAESEPQPRPELLDLIRQCKVLAERAARADERLAMAGRWEAEADALNEQVALLTAEQINAERALRSAEAGFDAEAAVAARVRLDQAEIALRGAEQRVVEQGRTLAVLAERDRHLKALAAERDGAASDAYDAGVTLQAASMLERAYGRNGVPALIMEQSAIPSIEQEANSVLERLGTSFTVTLETQRQLRSGDTADALDVVVHTPTGTALYEDLSGGERTRVDVALRLGLARLLAHRQGAEVRLLAMDEPAHLDEEGMQRLAGIMAELDPSFDRVLLVSHVPTLGDAFDQRIVIERDADDASVVADASAELVAVSGE